MRLIGLDLLRFVAAFGVVLYHYTADRGSFGRLSSITRFGYLGVPLFFIISGYVITLSARNRSAVEFAISRFVRLYPVFWVSVAFTLLVAFFCGSYHYSWQQIAANLTMLNGYLGYGNIDGVYWTLYAEFKFYGCIFLLLLVGIFEKVRVWLTLWLALTVLYLLTGQPFFLGWFISPFYSSFFIAGVAFYLVQKEGATRFTLCILISSLLISSVRAFEQTSEFMTGPDAGDKAVAVIVIWFWYLLFYGLVTERVRLSPRGSYLALGGITYPLYLIHSAAGKTIMRNAESILSEGSAVMITTIGMIAVSYLMHVGIEKNISIPMKTQLLAMYHAFVSFKNRLYAAR